MSRAGRKQVAIAGEASLRSRVAHGGLLALYALAAVLGLFLHSTSEGYRPRHTCEVGHADLDDGSGERRHDPAHCNLCHVHEGLGIALLDPAPPLVLDVAPAGDVVVPARGAPLASFAPPTRSRAPPGSLA